LGVTVTVEYDFGWLSKGYGTVQWAAKDTPDDFSRDFIFSRFMLATRKKKIEKR